MEMILNLFPHIKHRVIELGDEIDQFNFLIEHGINAVILDYVPPTGANYATYRGGVVFYLVDFESIVGAVRNTKGMPKPCWGLISGRNGKPSSLSEIIGNIFIRENHYGDYSGFSNNAGTNHLYQAYEVKVDRAKSYEEFNDFWRLTPYDVGYKDIVRTEHPAILNRVVKLSAERYAELSSQYGKNFYVLDIDVPKKSYHHRIDEGVIFWVETGSDSRQDIIYTHRILPNSLVSYRPDEKLPSRFLVIGKNRFGNFVYDVRYDHYAMKDFATRDFEEFHSFWKYKNHGMNIYE